MARGWIYNKDRAGKPRRFLNHREALWWSFKAGAVVAGIFAVPQALDAVLTLAGLQDDPVRLLFVLPLLLLIGATVFVLLYLYVALSGGVMDGAARRR